MLSLLKKKDEAAAAASAASPAWHPNFRNFERLPDIKQVRTAFFVNGAAIFLALAGLTYFTVQEYQLHSLNRQIEEWQRQIDQNKRASDQAVGLYKRFQDLAARTTDVESFVKSRPLLSELLLRFGETMPKNVALSGLDIRETGIALRGSARGAPDAATGYTSAYIDMLRADKTFAAMFEDISPTSVGRNPVNGRVVFEVFMKFKPAAKEAKKP